MKYPDFFFTALLLYKYNRGGGYNPPINFELFRKKLSSPTI